MSQSPQPESSHQLHSDAEEAVRRQEVQAHSYRLRLRSAHILGHDNLSSNANSDFEESDDDDEIEADDIEQLMEGNQTYQENTKNNEPEQPTVQSLLTMPGRYPVLVPEWGDELTRRCVQEQLNASARLDGVSQGQHMLITQEPPTGMDGPEDTVMIPTTLQQYLGLFDGMRLAQRGTNLERYPEPAFGEDVQQFVLTMGCAWIDRNLFRFSESLQLTRQVIQPIAKGSHFLVALLRPDQTTTWVERQPVVQRVTAATLADTSEQWATLDLPIPSRASTITSVMQDPHDLSSPESGEVVPCQVSSDVDSLILISDQLPISHSLEIPSIPSREHTIRYSNKVCLPAGPKKKRTLLSRIPNFRLGQAGRLTVNICFPEAYDPGFEGYGSSQISSDKFTLIWDQVIQPSLLASFHQGAGNSLPQSGRYEKDRQREIGGQARPSWRTTSVPSDALPLFVSEMRRRLSEADDPELRLFHNFKFVLSLQGFKSFSFTLYDDLTHSELNWYNSLALPLTCLRPLMLFKGYLKGLRRVTKDVLIGDWLDYNDVLQRGIERVRRLSEWELCKKNHVPFPDQPLDGDDLDRELHPFRRRNGPSLQLSAGISKLCTEIDCDTCGVWMDVAAEMGSAGKVTVWNHSHCFDIVNTLVGRSNFDRPTEWTYGARTDEVATMPGLGGVAFTDRRAPSYGFNSPTPYIQLYCQEKVPTYASWGNKARGAQNLDAMPARKLPMNYMLDCSGAPENKLNDWIETEHRILGDAASDPTRSFPARLEVRTSLNNLLESTFNIVVALSRATESDAFRHYESNAWFRWKGIRAEYLARLPGAIFGNRGTRPTEWTMVHALLSAQTFTHGLHSRVPDVTIERDIVNMHTSYLRVEENADGTISFEHPNHTLTLKERAQSKAYRPFFPAGVRTLQGYYHRVTGLRHMEFERDMLGMSSAEDKWNLKVRRGVKCKATTGISRLRSLIIYLPKNRKASSTNNRIGYPRLDRDTGVRIQQDPHYARLEGIVDGAISSVLDGTLLLGSKEGKSLKRYLEHEILDIPRFIIQFGRSLGLLGHTEHAVRLRDLERLQQDEGQTLAVGPGGEVQVLVETLGGKYKGVTNSVAHSLDAGTIDVYNFQKHLPATTAREETPIRRLKVEWDILYHSMDGPTLPDLRLPSTLRLTCLPKMRTEDDRQDDVAYRDWLHRIEDAHEAYPNKFYNKPSIGNMAVYIFACFQQQLLLTIPKTVRANAHHPEQEGDPYIRVMHEKDGSVTQNLMRESFSGLPARLTRFVATQYSLASWESLASMFFPSTVEDCGNHPGWSEPAVTYLDMWRRLLERIEPLANCQDIRDMLGQLSSVFVRSFKILPDLTGKGYNSIAQKRPGGRPVSIWDDTSFEKSAKANPTPYQPRWMTINSGGRISNRIRLAYTFTDEAQIRYMGTWQSGRRIQESKPNFGKRYPSPAPFEHAWMVDNYHTILSERAYMVMNKEVPAAHFLPVGATKGIGHDYWHPRHSSVSCTVCRAWNMLNPSSLDDDEFLSIANPNTFNMGGKDWGYFACEPDHVPLLQVKSSSTISRKRQKTGSGNTTHNPIDVDAMYYV